MRDVLRHFVPQNDKILSFMEITFISGDYRLASTRNRICHLNEAKDFVECRVRIPGGKL